MGDDNDNDTRLALEWVSVEIYSGLDSVLYHCCIGSEGNSFNVTNAITGKINEIFSRIFEKTFSKVIHSQSKIVIQNNNTPHRKFYLKITKIVYSPDSTKRLSSRSDFSRPEKGKQ